MGFKHQIINEDIGFWYAKGKSIMSGKEFHSYHEILYIMEAEGYLLSEQGKTALSGNTIILIPKETFHSFDFTEESSYLRCRIWFSDIPQCNDIIDQCMNQIRIMTKPNVVIEGLFRDLCDSFPSGFSISEQKLLLRSAVLRLLLEIKRNIGSFLPPAERGLDSLIAQALEYINMNYLQEINIDKIAAKLFVSRSQLSHSFSKELNISVYKYIINKRLIHAEHLMKNGCTAAEACTASGFGDYSSFYRIYKKQYGHSPSNKYRHGS